MAVVLAVASILGLMPAAGGLASAVSKAFGRVVVADHLSLTLEPGRSDEEATALANVEIAGPPDAVTSLSEIGAVRRSIGS